MMAVTFLDQQILNFVNNLIEFTGNLLGTDTDCVSLN